MSTSSPRRSRLHDVRLLARQVRFEQLSFWRNWYGALFTVGFSVIFLILLGASGSSQRFQVLGGVKEIQYYVPAFAAYGVMSACFNLLGITLVNRRETGLLKRLRLSPLPTWMALGAIFINALIISVIQVVILLLVGRFGYGLLLPHNYLPLLLSLVVGVVCFTALGVAASSIVPNQDSAGPILGLVFFILLFLAGLWFPLAPGSGLAKFSAYLPFRHFIIATFAPFNPIRGASPWSNHDILVMAIWAVAGVFVAFRRFRFEPHRI